MQDQFRATILALIAVVLWSTVATAFKLSLRYLDPYQLVAYASLFASLILLLGVVSTGRLGELWAVFQRRPWLFLLLGFLSPFAYYLILFQAYDLLPAQQAQSINYTWAITLGLLSIPFLKKVYGVRDAIGALTGYVGVVVIVTRGDPFAFGLDSPPGVALALFSTLIWAAYWILNTRIQDDSLLCLCLSFLCGLPFTLAACIVFSDIGAVNWPGLAGAAYVGLFEMGITFVIWLAALKRAHNIARISSLIFLAPFLSMIPISYILGEAVVPATLIGLGLILFGTLVQQVGREQP